MQVEIDMLTAMWKIEIDAAIECMVMSNGLRINNGREDTMRTDGKSHLALLTVSLLGLLW